MLREPDIAYLDWLWHDISTARSLAFSISAGTLQVKLGNSDSVFIKQSKFEKVVKWFASTLAFPGFQESAVHSETLEQREHG